MSIRRWLSFLFPWTLIAGGINSGSVLLLNDAPFILSATIQGSDGTFLGQITLQPGEQKNFTQNLSPTGYEHPGAPQISLTPYTVIWQCASDDYYSMCNNVSPGSLVRANDCFGYRICRPKKEAKPAPPASTLEKKK